MRAVRAPNPDTINGRARALVKSSIRSKFNPRMQIGDLLCQLGLPHYNRNFWLDNHGHLDEIFHDARQRYRQLAARLQPRTLTDDREAATQLNAVWAEIKRRFRQHINGQLVLPKPANGSRRPEPPPPGHFSRICALDGCGIRFITKVRKKKFCVPYHGTLFWLRKARKIVVAQRKVLLRRCLGCRLLFKTTDSRKVYHSRRCKRNAGERRKYWKTRTVISKICAWEKCGRPFKTTNPRQIFHKQACQRAVQNAGRYWKKKKKKKRRWNPKTHH
jgi:hypothetical protein